MTQLTRVLFRGHSVDKQTHDILTEFLACGNYTRVANKFGLTRHCVTSCVSRYRKKAGMPSSLARTAGAADARDANELASLWDLAHGRRK